MLTYIAVIILNSAANILIKLGMRRAGNLEALNYSTLSKIATNPYFWTGCFCFMMSLVAYSYLLSKINLSIAYPVITSAAFTMVSLCSVFFLGEKIGGVQTIGILFTIIGMWMIVR
jgi:multidrug transporter EmrE-like cation transporter